MNFFLFQKAYTQFSSHWLFDLCIKKFFPGIFFFRPGFYFRISYFKPRAGRNGNSWNLCWKMFSNPFWKCIFMSLTGTGLMLVDEAQGFMGNDLLSVGVGWKLRTIWDRGGEVGFESECHREESFIFEDVCYGGDRS